MSDLLKTRLKKYGCCAAFVVLFVVLFVTSKDMTNAQPVDWYLVLCDAFTVPGILLIMAGCLVWASSKGALDGVVYCVRFAVYSLIPGKRLERDERYGDYLERKMANRPKGFGFLFYSGLVTMAVALIFMVLFYRLYS